MPSNVVQESECDRPMKMECELADIWKLGRSPKPAFTSRLSGIT